MSKETINVVFMGTPKFTLPPLAALIKIELFNVLAVVTQEDKKIGRKQEITPPPAKIMALQNGIPVLQPPRVKGNTEFIDLLRGLNPDFIVVVAYGQILPKEVIDIPKYGCINIHGSLLPMYRGASPVEAALLNGDKETGITFMKIAEKLDSGDIYFAERIAIDPKDTSESVREKLSYLAGTLLPFTLKDIMDGVLEPIPQDHSKATYCKKIKKEDGEIDLRTMTAEEIINRLRAYTPWPSCFLRIDGKRIKILEADFKPDSKNIKAGSATITKDTVSLGTKKGTLILQKVQLEGKKPTSIQDFLKGNSGLFKKLLASEK